MNEDTSFEAQKDIKTRIYCERNSIPYPRRRFQDRNGIYFEHFSEENPQGIKIYEKDFNFDENDIEYINRFKEIKKEQKIRRLKQNPCYKMIKKIAKKLELKDDDLLSDDE